MLLDALSGTEFFHTVRYLDVGPDGWVTMAPRMKEVRYAKKVRWYGYALLRETARREAREQAQTADGTHAVRCIKVPERLGDGRLESDVRVTRARWSARRTGELGTRVGPRASSVRRRA